MKSKVLRRLLSLSLCAAMVIPTTVAYAAEVTPGEQVTEDEAVVLSEEASTTADEADVPTAIADENGFVIEDGVLTKYTGTAAEVVIPDGVTSIGFMAFWENQTITSVTIPGSVTSIGDYAFGRCSSLKNVTLSEGLKSIGGSAFGGTSLTSLEIPASVTEMPLGMAEYDLDPGEIIDGCNSLQEIVVSPNNAVYASYDGCVYNKDMTVLWRCPAGKRTVKIAEGVQGIGLGAFFSCDSLTDVTLPVGLRWIDISAFMGCTSLASVTIPNTVYNIYEDNVFYYCDNVTIYGKEGSYAQEYANEYGISFKSYSDSRLAAASFTFDGTQDLTFSFSGLEGVKEIKRIAFECVDNVQSADVDWLLWFDIDNYGTSYNYDLQNKTLTLYKSAVSALLYESPHPAIGNTYQGCITYVTTDGTEKTTYGEWYIKVLERSAEATVQNVVRLPKGQTSISKEEMQNLVEINKTQDVVIITAEGIYFTFAKGTMQMVDGKETYDFGAEIIKEYSKLTNPPFDESEFVARINYNYSGKLPGTASITIPVETKWAGKTLYYYEIKSDGTYSYVTNGTVDANGNVTVKQDHCSNYVLSTKAPAQSPKTGEDSMGYLSMVLSLLALFGAMAFVGLYVSKRRVR